MNALQVAFLIVALVLFVLDAVWPAFSDPAPVRWRGSALSLGLAFFAAAFLIPAFG